MRRERLDGRLSGALALAAAMLLAGPASAQAPSQLALNRFDPAPAGDRMFGVQSPFAAGKLTPHVMLLADYAHNPLVLRTDAGKELSKLVSSQLFLHLNASLSLWNRLNVNVDAPIALFQDGDSAAGPPPTVGGVQFGDLRFGLRLRLFGEYHDPFQIALGGYVWVPTGPSSSFVTDGKVRGLPQVILGGRVAERFIWSAAAGPELRPAVTFSNVAQGAMMKLGAGFGFLLGDDRHWQLGAESSVSMVLDDINKRTVNAEVLGDVRYRIIDDLEVGIGVGPGLTSGVGTPALRAIAMVAYTPEQKKPVPDRDGDGILDAVDACPDEKGVASEDPKKHGCPVPPDTDGDGILDAADACPSVKGVADEDPKKNGCPPDRDGDGILDAADACIEVKGIADADPKKNGCPPPPDRDGDGIADAVDACPDVKGVADANPKFNGCPIDIDADSILNPADACPEVHGVPHKDPRKHGCPPAARLEGKEILILEQVQFDTGTAKIKGASDDLLDEVAKVLREHPEIAKLEVQGHTDDRGHKVSNKVLSQNRAAAVKKALITRKIAEKRMTAKGYGQDKPIADNGTDEGRQKNRRVQFVILDRAKK